MTSTGTCVYSVQAFGNSAALNAALAAASLPLGVLGPLGLRVASDSATACVRTIVLAFNPTSTAVVTPVLQASSPSPIASLTITSAGSGYAAPPVLEITDTGAGSGAYATATLNVGTITVTAGGSSYTSPVVAVEGGLAPNGVAATATATVAGGVITGITITNPGGPYTSIPTVVIADPAGSGATATAALQIGAVDLITAGQNYSAPAVTVVPLFQDYFPTVAAQTQALAEIFLTGLQQQLRAQVIASAPVIA